MVDRLQGSRDGRPGPRRVLTVANLVTILRLGCVPLFLWVLFGRDDPWAAAWLLGALGATDWVDGYLARRLDQVSELGKVLDPVADRVLLVVGGGAVLLHGSVPLVVAAVVLLREALVSAGTLGLALAGARRIDVRWVGKAGTFALMFAFPLFLGSDAGRSTDAALRAAAWAFAVVGVVLAWAAAVAYVPEARLALRERRVGSSA